MLWVDKHRPTSLRQLNYHSSITKCLENLAQSNDFPHLLVYGPSGSGKKTRIMSLLTEMYGNGVLKMRLEHKSFTPSNSSSKIEITTVASNFHIEINPSDVGNKDRFVVQELLKEIAQYHLVDTHAKKPFKVVILSEVDKLSKQAQHGLRRTMEKYTASCRLILCCQNPSKVIDPLRSRCVGIRVSSPKEEEIVSILQNIADRELIQIPESLAQRIAQTSKRNLRRAILMFETCKVQSYPLTSNQSIPLPAWEEYIGIIAKDILQEQTPSALLKIREKLYELIGNCIPAEIIIKNLSKELMNRLDDDLKHELASLAAFYEHRLQCGSKEVFHLEAFIVKFMAIYKRFLLDFYM